MADFSCQGLPQKKAIIAAFQRYGYGANNAMSDADYRLLVRAFQMHFRPDRCDGVMDSETCSVLYALNDKYKSR